MVNNKNKDSCTSTILFASTKRTLSSWARVKFIGRVYSHGVSILISLSLQTIMTGSLSLKLLLRSTMARLKGSLCYLMPKSAVSNFWKTIWRSWSWPLSRPSSSSLRQAIRISRVTRPTTTPMNHTKTTFQSTRSLSKSQSSFVFKSKRWITYLLRSTDSSLRKTLKTSL